MFIVLDTTAAAVAAPVAVTPAAAAAVAPGIGGDLVEEVQLIDNFTNPKTQRTSNCYRITYRSMERSLTDEEINKLQDDVRKGVADQLKVELR
jgi:phenylalanyl-tRNA synthetase alpha chain